MPVKRRALLGASLSATFGAPASRSASAQQSSTIRLGMGASQVLTIDPIRLTQGVDNWAITHVFDLLARAPSGRFAASPAEYSPSLAASWTSSADAKTWEFKLREGVAFHKGYGECTAEDVKFTFDRVRDPAQGSAYAVLYSNIAEVQAEAGHVVRFRLKQPDPLFLSSTIDMTGSNIVCAKAVREKQDGFARDPIGTGPYQMASIEPKMVRLTANPAYFGGKPAVPNISIAYILDTSARALAILGGSVEMILAPAGPGAISSIQSRDPKLRLDVALPGNSWSVAFNLRRKPFDDVRVRQAFAYAINRSEISASLTPPTPPVYGLNAPSVPGGFTKATVPPALRYDHDPDKARALLAEAGFPSGLTFGAFCSQRDDYASLMLIMQEQLRQVGVNMDLRLVDHAAFHADSRKDLNSFVLRGGAYPPVPTVPFMNEIVADGDVKPDGTGGNNFSHYGVAMPGIDELLNAGMAEPDIAKRLALIGQMESRMLTDLPIIPLCTTAFVIIRNPRLRLGFEVTSGLGFWRLDKATLA